MNCKPGDLAYIVRAFCPENVGTIVEVLNQFDNDPQLGPCWMTRSARPTPTNWGIVATEAWCRDADLRPISGGKVSDKEVRDLYAPTLPEVA